MTWIVYKKLEKEQQEEVLPMSEINNQNIQMDSMDAGLFVES